MSNNNVNWFFITQKIEEKNFTPIISNQVINNSLFGKGKAARGWADEIQYPLADSDNLTRVAQFLSVTLQDASQAKSRYLHFLKQSLLALARTESNSDNTFLDSFTVRKLRRSTFSRLAEELRYPDFKKEKDNPLSILAALDIPIYLTTSHHRFMEAALEAVGKTPRTEVYCWRERLEENIPPECRTDLYFEPDVQKPLVYHWHGIDTYPDSLVLTEDDYLEFLVNVAKDFRDPDIVPSTVRNALSSSLLLLLGYDLHAWDLRVLAQGLIKGDAPRPRSLTIQLIPSEESIKNSEHFQEYLQKYFGRIEFDVYWGTPQSFMKTLWEEWEAG